MNKTLKLALRIVSFTVVAVAIGAGAVCVYLLATAPPAESPEIFLQVGHQNSVNAVAWSPDGATLASGSSDATIKLWDVANGDLRRTLTGHQGRVLSVAWSPDGATLASGSDDGTVELWDVANGELRRTLTGHQGSVRSVAWSPDGATLASGSDDGTVKLWDVASGELGRTLTGPQGIVFSVAWSPDGATLASRSDDVTVKLWDVASGELRRTLTGHQGTVRSVAWSPDGATLASGSEDATVKLWDVASGELRRTLTSPGPQGRVVSVAWSPDGATLASGSDDGTVKLLDVASGDLRRTLTGPQGSALSVAWSPDGATLASGSEDATVKLWDVASGELGRTLTGHQGSVRSVAWSPDRATLASGSSDATVKLWDVGSGELRRTLTGQQGIVLSVAWSPDGATLASGSYDATVKLWDVASGELRRTLTGHQGIVGSVAWSPDGATLASGSFDDTVKLWDVASGELRRTLTGHQGSVLSVAWSPDGATLASGSYDANVKLWDVASGELRRTLTGHQGSVLSVAWSPDGATLASGSLDATVKLWDVASGELRRTLTGHQGSVLSVAWSPDGTTLASGSLDATVKQWDVASGELRRTLTGHQGSVLSVAWSPDGVTLASGSLDATVKLWDANTGDLLSTTANFAGGQYLAFRPDSLRCRSSRQEGEPEPAAVRFDNRTWPVYPLHYYRDQIWVTEGASWDSPTESIGPKPIRLAWERFLNKRTWFGVGLTLYAAALMVVLVLARRADPLEISKKFFAQALGADLEQSGPALLRAKRPSDAAPALILLRTGTAVDLDPAVAEQLASSRTRGKLYLIYTTEAPPADDLQALRTKTRCHVVPASSATLERALAEGKANTETLRRLEEPFVVREDPYDESRPVESSVLFYGRGDALTKIPAALQQGQHVGLFGLRKVGKTSLLNQIRDSLSSTPSVLIDCQAFAPVALDLFAEILGHLRQECIRLGVNNPPSVTPLKSANDFRTQFLQLHHAWAKRSSGGRIVLIFDEIDKYFPDRENPKNERVLTEYVALFRMLRGLAQEKRCLSVLVVAYRPDVNRQNLLTETTGENPMYMSYQEYFLGFLDTEETLQMLREIGQWQDIAWDERALEETQALTGGHPLLARMVASDACEQGARKEVSAGHVEEVAAEIRGSFHKHRIGRYFDESIWRYLREDEREVLRNAALDAGALGTESEDALANLEHFGLLRSDGDRLQVEGTLLRDWLRRV